MASRYLILRRKLCKISKFNIEKLVEYDARPFKKVLGIIKRGLIILNYN